jgi:tetratricopeptide (TPR) repeat protein
LEFSKSKTDEQYGAKCIEQMLEIYINPDNNITLIDLGDPFNGKTSTKMLTYNTKDLNIEAIQFLLKELKTRRNDENTQIYETYVMILLKDPSMIEKSIENLQDILNKNNENIAAWVALAMANLILLKTNEVKTNLKIIEKASLNIKYYNEYERGLLIFAYLMMITENTKKAEEILNKIITEVNVSQIKAYDLLGMLKERDKKYQEASDNYEKAWEFSNKNSAHIGYKLAACYVNSKNSIKAINVCNEIKRKFKDYPIDDLALQAKNSLSG